MPEAERATLETQIQTILRLLEGKRLPSDSRECTTAIQWIKNFPSYIDQRLKEQLKHAIYTTFSISEAELLASVEGITLPKRVATLGSRENELRRILPQGGWFTQYDEYTRYNEAPLSYHIFASLCVLGASLGRRVHFSMGHFNIWPNYCVILVGPTGRTKKTIAADIAKRMIVENVLCPMMSDEPSPQALNSSLAEQGGHCFVYASELSVFFGRDKFKEGMIPKFLRMLDSPATFEVDTVSRGKEIIHNLAITFIGGTTPGQFNTTMPAIVSSSGFMNRFLFVVEHDTERCYPRPWVGLHEEELFRTVKRLQRMEGVVDFAKGVEDSWWGPWYRQRKAAISASTDDTLIEVMERLPGHLLRTAMLIHLVQCDNFALCEKCLTTAEGFLRYLDKNTPSLVQGIKQTAGSTDAEYVYSILARSGGAADHSTLLRKVASRMNAQQFKLHIKTLEESGRLKVSKRGYSQFYILVEELNTDAH